MNQESREKIALFVFLALIIATLAGVVIYLQVGHSWNQAAITIDDASGDMDGYTAIVYHGVNVPTVAEAKRETKPVPVSVAVKNYEGKGAKVLSIDVLDADRYEGDDIFLVGGKRIGVFFASEGITPIALQHHARWFHEHGVDAVVCVAEDAEPFVGKSEGVDIIISLMEHSRFKTGYTSGGTYFTNVPIVGRIGATVISPSGVVSVKDIESVSD